MTDDGSVFQWPDSPEEAQDGPAAPAVDQWDPAGDDVAHVPGEMFVADPVGGATPIAGTVTPVGGPSGAVAGQVVLSDIRSASEGRRLHIVFTLDNRAGFSFEPAHVLFQVRLIPFESGAQENFVVVPNPHRLDAGESYPTVDMEADPGTYIIEITVFDGQMLPLSGGLTAVHPLSAPADGSTDVPGQRPAVGHVGPVAPGTVEGEITVVEHVGRSDDGTHEYRVHYLVHNRGTADIAPGLEVTIRAQGDLGADAQQTFHLQLGVPAGATGPERYLTLNLRPGGFWLISVETAGHKGVGRGVTLHPDGSVS